MTKRMVARAVAMGFVASIVAGCAVRTIPDPRNPAPARDGPVQLRVCYVDGDGAHLAVGDQVELTTNNFGGLRIRHVPATAGAPAWNGGDDTAVRDAVLVEQVAQGGGARNVRRFVPVGRFGVRLPDSAHARFDFLASKAVANLSNNRFPECNVPLGADEVILRGVEDDARHGGHAILR